MKVGRGMGAASGFSTVFVGVCRFVADGWFLPAIRSGITVAGGNIQVDVGTANDVMPDSRRGHGQHWFPGLTAAHFATEYPAPDDYGRLARSLPGLWDGVPGGPGLSSAPL